MKKAVITQSGALNGLLNGKELEVIHETSEGTIVRYDGQRLLLLKGIDEFSIVSECKPVPGRSNYHICVYCGNTNRFYRIREIKLLERAVISNDQSEDDIEWQDVGSLEDTSHDEAIYCSHCEKEAITLKWEQYVEYCSGKGEVFEKIKKYKEINARSEHKVNHTEEEAK